MKLITGSERDLIDNGTHAWHQPAGAVLGFAYDQVVYNDDDGSAFKRIGAEHTPLTADEIAAIHAWIAGLDVPAQLATPPDEAARYAREERDRRLTASDWVVVRAAEEGTPVPAEWIAYRQALRDVPHQSGFPQSIAWPTSP